MLSGSLSQRQGQWIFAVMCVHIRPTILVSWECTGPSQHIVFFYTGCGSWSTAVSCRPSLRKQFNMLRCMNQEQLYLIMQRIICVAYFSICKCPIIGDDWVPIAYSTSLDGQLTFLPSRTNQGGKHNNYLYRLCGKQTDMVFGFFLFWSFWENDTSLVERLSTPTACDLCPELLLIQFRLLL